MQELHVPHPSKGSSDGQQRAGGIFARGREDFQKYTTKLASFMVACIVHKNKTVQKGC